VAEGVILQETWTKGGFLGLYEISIYWSGTPEVRTELGRLSESGLEKSATSTCRRICFIWSETKLLQWAKPR